MTSLQRRLGFYPSVMLGAEARSTWEGKQSGYLLKKRVLSLLYLAFLWVGLFFSVIHLIQLRSETGTEFSSLAAISSGNIKSIP